MVLPLGAQTPRGTSITAALQGSLPGPVLLPPQGAPHLSPGTIPLQEPQSLERSSRCHSDAGRCRAQRGHCKTLAGCHCHGECPSGEGWKHQKKIPGSAPKVKIPLAPHLHPMVNSGAAALTSYRASCSVHNSLIPRFFPRGLWATTWHSAAELQSHGINMVDLPAEPILLNGVERNIKASDELKADTF